GKRFCLDHDNLSLPLTVQSFQKSATEYQYFNLVYLNTSYCSSSLNFQVVVFKPAHLKSVLAHFEWKSLAAVELAIGFAEVIGTKSFFHQKCERIAKCSTGIH
ncbi:MAG TPA: hypothetical protein VGK77_11500, partial [Candidatus Binatia bacterium]